MNVRIGVYCAVCTQTKEESRQGIWSEKVEREAAGIKQVLLPVTCHLHWLVPSVPATPTWGFYCALFSGNSWPMCWWSKVKPLHNSLTPDYTSVGWVCSHMIWRIHHWPTVLQVLLLLLLLHHRCCSVAKTEKELDGDTCSDEYLDCRWKPRALPLPTFFRCCCYRFYITRTLLCRLRRSACKGENTLQVFWYNSNSSV